MINFVNTTHRLATSVLIVALASISTACTNSALLIAPNTNSLNLESTRKDQVRDLLSVLPQILNPLNTTIQISRANSENSRTAISVLAEQGYGLQRVDADTGKYLLEVDAAFEQSILDSGIHKITIAIGELKLSRSYGLIQLNQLSDQQQSAAWASSLNWQNSRAVIPVSELRVSGTDRIPDIKGMGLELENRMALGSGTKSLEFRPSRIKIIESLAMTEKVPALTIINADLINRVVSAMAPGQSVADKLVSEKQETNVFGLDANRFASVFDSHNRIIREYVIFPNDSQRLGKMGKRLVLNLVKRFSSNTDMFGLIGCSNGPTSLTMGNQGLALGRAERITEELVAAGVPQSSIVREGCWSSTTGAEGFPNRGVVIDLWRRAG